MRKKILRGLLASILLVAMLVTVIPVTPVQAVENISRAAAVQITKQPVSVTVEEGEMARVTVSATGDGLTYAWYYKNAGATTFSLTTTYTGKSYAVSMNDARNGRQVYCVVTDKYGNSVTSNTVTLSMKNAAVQITQQPVSVTVEEGEMARVTVSAAGDGLTYAWYYKNAGETKFALTTTYTGKSYAVSMNDARNGRQVYCVVTDKYGNSVTSDTVTLRMKGPAVQITKQPVSVAVVEGEMARVTVSATGDGLTYAWYFKNPGSAKFSLTTSYTGATYNFKMDEVRSGRQVYCVITDKYGNSVTSNTVTLSLAAKETVQITQQPVSVTVAEGEMARVTVSAIGDGLTYAWYYKNVGETKFSLTTTYTGKSYAVSMEAARNGRQVYCVVTDKYGNSVTSNTVTLLMKGTEVKITKQPVSVTVKVGEMAKVTVSATGDGLTYAWYFKNPGSTKFSLTTSYTGASYNFKMDEARSGRQVYCVITDKYGNSVQTDVVTLSAVSVYTITADLGNGESLVVGVGSSGKYALTTPTWKSYIFQGWVDENGKAFPASGTITKNVKIKATWKAVGVKTLAELVQLTDAGVGSICIAADIEIDRPIYISYDTTIYADKDYSLRRASYYGGDLFVVGRDRNGVTAILQHRKAVLTLGGGKGTLTIDGNRDNMKVQVKGSAVFVADSATLYLYDGIRIANNVKHGNERVFVLESYQSHYSLQRAGGAAILNVGATVHMYGGILENNLVSTEHTVVTDPTTGEQTSYEANGNGGAVFNLGNFHMYGGEIRNNEALRGGGLYNDRYMYLYAGVVEDNLSHTYGGAVSTSSSANANTHIGNEKNLGAMIIRNNHSFSAGGGIYSSTTSPINIYANTQFLGNHSDSSGGAVYTAGPLIIRDAKFVGNYSAYSGGAIYYHYNNPDYGRRYLTLSDSYFEGNYSGLGGAICLSTSGTVTDKGSLANITNCRFVENMAVETATNPGNGGAIYITRKAQVNLTACDFIGNTAKNNAGALAIHSEAKVTIQNCDIQGNTAAFGGGVYVSSESTVTMKNVTVRNNAAALKENGTGGNGGGLYLSSDNITLNNVDLVGNTAANNGGAVLMVDTTLNMDATCAIENNSAGNHGGAFYLTYSTDAEGIKHGSVLKLNGSLLQGNTALAGGAISARSASQVIMTDVCFQNNTTPNAVSGDGNGGGAIYSNNSTIQGENVIFDGNASGYYGGALRLDACDTVLKNSVLKNNAGGTGAAIYTSGGTLRMDTVTLNSNTAKVNGVIYTSAKEVVMTNITAVNNRAGNGGVLYTSGSAKATLTKITARNNTASNGGVLYVAGSSVVTVTDSEFTENSSTSHGGAAYVYGATLHVGSGNTFTGNTAGGNGGAINATDREQESGNGKISGNVTIQNASFVNNTGNCGGAVYFNDSNYAIQDCTFIENAATSTSYGGGAVYNTGATGTLDRVTFTNNTALRGGAVALYTNSSMTVTDVVATGNTATMDGGAFFVNNCSLVLKPGQVVLKNNSANKGGALNVQGCDINLQNAKLEGNTATENGGAILISGATLTITGKDTVIQGNTAGSHGGVIYATYTTDANGVRTGATLNITGVTMESNQALYGGAISGRTDSVLNLTDVVLKENKTPNATVENQAGGGAIYCNNAKMTLSGCTLIGNASGYYGGAIKAEATNVVLKDGTKLEGNTGGTGAALHLSSSSTLDATDLVVKDNISSANGVLYLNGKGFTFQNLVATGNRASWNGGVLYIGGGNTVVTLNGGQLEDNTSGNGGAVAQFSGKLILDGTKVIGNQATSKGGAIYAEGGIVTAKAGTTFQNNEAVNGGAIAVINGVETNLNQANFTGNTATSSGGAVYIAGATLNISGGSYKQNTTTGNGGAVAVFEYSYKISDTETGILKSNVTINDAVFQENTADRGGALYVSKNEYTLNNAQFLNNTATNVDYGGGAIYTTGAQGMASGLTLTGNSSVKGGAVALHSLSELTVTSATATGNAAVKNSQNKLGVGGVFYVNNSTLKLLGSDGSVSLHDNTATSGAAVQVENGGKLTIQGAAIANHAVTGSGGAVYASGSEVTVKNTTFTGNAAANGGAVYLTGSPAVVEDSTFTGNTASGNGGALYISGTTVTGENNTFTSNSAVGHGGGIYVSYVGSGDSRVGGMLTFRGGSFQNNTAMAGGAVSIRSASAASFDGTTFVGNSVEGCDSSNEGVAEGDGEGGGAIYVGYGEVTLKDVIATGNSSATYGGMIDAVSSKVTVTGGTFSDNKAMTGGAVYAMTNSAVTITDAELKENESTYDNIDYNNDKGGGAIAMVSGNLKLTGVTLDGNKTDYYGGGILANGVTVIMDSCVVKNHTGATGAALAFKNCTTTITGGVIQQNTSTGNGVVYANAGLLTMNQVTGSDNTCVSGLIFASGNNEVFLNRSTFTGNTGKNGAVLHQTGGKVIVNGGTFSGNSATGNGGALYSTTATLEINGATFANNSAKSGGAVCIVGSTLNANGENTFNGNSAADHGGAVYVSYYTNTDNSKRPGVMNMTGGTFTGNTALAGGAISARTSCEVNLTGTVIKENSATGKETNQGGGAIYVNNNTLNLSGVTLQDNTSAYYGGAIVTSAATVNIQNNTVISGNTGATGGALCFRDSGTYTLTDVTLTDNVSTKGSGVIYVTGSSSLTISGLTASGNQNSNGGVLYISGSAIVAVEDSTFTGNKALNNGGAIDHRGSGTLTVTNSTFVDNTAKLGGAVYANGTGAVTFTDCTFRENIASQGGGAIYVDAKANVTVNGGELKQNASTYQQPETHDVTIGGGAAMVAGGQLTLTDVTVTSNTAGYGGAVNISSGVLNATDCTVKENSATFSGGVIAATAPEANGTKVTLTGGSFVDNEANVGGAAYITGAQLNIVGGTYQENTSTGNGGAVYVNDYTYKVNETDTDSIIVKSSLTISGAVFRENTGDRGGAVYVGKNTFSVTDTQFLNNTAKGKDYGGGAIYMTESKGSTASGLTLTGNSSVKGGAVALHSLSELTVTSMTATGNTAVKNSENQQGVGGVFYVNNATLKLLGTDGSIQLGTAESGNTAESGGAIRVENGGKLTIQDAVIIGNSATDGGAVYIYGNTTEATIRDTTFRGNSVTNNGGAVYMTGTTVTGENNIFDSNSAAKHGGAVYVSYIGSGDARASGVLLIKDGSFINNTAMAGGAVSVRTSCSATFDGTTFTGNSVEGCDATNEGVADGDGEGGGVIYVGYGEVTLKDVIASGNISAHYGGVIDSYSGTVNIYGGTYENNRATLGGGVIYAPKSTVTMQDATFTGNQTTDTTVTASIGGGVIQIINGELNISGSSFIDNTAGYYGGAVLANKSTVAISGNTTVQGSVGSTGAALYFRENCTVTMEKVTLSGNTSKGNGVVYINTGSLTMTDITGTDNTCYNGMLFVSGNTQVSVNNGDFSGNTGKNGAVLHQTGGKVIVSGGTFSGNTVTGNGGAIYSAGGTLEITDGTFTGNTAKNGGAIALDGGASATIQGGIFTNNIATGNGGAVYVMDSSEAGTANTTLIMSNANLKGNSATMGGALATDTVSENLKIQVTDCTFEENSSTSGGGAVSIQNGNCNSATDPTEVKIVFTDCTFMSNAAGTTGGAIEIRTNSCAKIAGIIATNNQAKGSPGGGVLYVTSNYSRLYLTGTVTASGNTANSGNFLYLYNNNYTNPPKLYTTHSDTAAWYSDVKGNRTNVVFDLATLP